MKDIKVYSINGDEVLEHTLRGAHYFDPMSPSIPKKSVIADADLPAKTDNQAYLISGERNKDGHYIVSNNVSVVADYRNVDTYRTDDGEVEKVTNIGELPSHLTKHKRPSVYHTWDSRWIVTDEAKSKRLNDTKDRKLLELNQLAEGYITKATKKDLVPAFEQATWPIQRQEATAWQSDKSSPTPNIDLIAKNRGVDRVVLIQKIIAKSAQFQLLTSTIAGQRQRYEDELDKAVTLEEIEACSFDFDFQD